MVTTSRIQPIHGMLRCITFVFSRRQCLSQEADIETGSGCTARVDDIIYDFREKRSVDRPKTNLSSSYCNNFPDNISVGEIHVRASRKQAYTYHIDKLTHAHVNRISISTFGRNEKHISTKKGI